MAQRVAAVLLPLVLLAFGCRTDKDRSDESAALAVSSSWYDAGGKAADCGPVPPSCPAASDQRTFVDLCVAQGFQAKTCGCEIRCSGHVGPVPAAAPELALTGVAAGKGGKAPPPARACSADDKAYVDSVVQAREPGALLTRCLDSHVCNGNVGWCVGDSLKASTRLRALARQGCEAEVYGTVCKDGYQDSLSCPEPDVQKLSRLWAEFYAKDSSSKRCIRNVVCSDERTFCTPDALKQALDAKVSVDRDGCEYWLRTLCNLNGGKAW